MWYLLCLRGTANNHTKGEVVIATGSKSWELVLLRSQIIKNIISALEEGLYQNKGLELITVEVDLLF